MIKHLNYIVLFSNFWFFEFSANRKRDQKAQHNDMKNSDSFNAVSGTSGNIAIEGDFAKYPQIN